MGCFSSKPEETNEPAPKTPAATTSATTPQGNTGMDIDHTDPKLLPSAQCIQMPAELLEKAAAPAEEKTTAAAAEPAAAEEQPVDPKLLPSAQTIAQPAGFVLEAQKKEAAAQQAAAAAASK
ncbi:hypothetical protein FOZ61_000244 [Perkinsus olseni]|uniref:Uncharacterized protein n=1 Tax=Perkinsus olseni TaxID=32597 RepID=A0A7J6KVB3_PEROL|nr:hypothetical protein FOZ61_000244 [Perkinsus olseni]